MDLTEKREVRQVAKLEKELEGLKRDYKELSVVQGPHANSRTLHRHDHAVAPATNAHAFAAATVATAAAAAATRAASRA
jgi:hypothetical protein